MVRCRGTVWGTRWSMGRSWLSTAATTMRQLARQTLWSATMELGVKYQNAGQPAARGSQALLLTGWSWCRTPHTGPWASTSARMGSCCLGWTQQCVSMGSGQARLPLVRRLTVPSQATSTMGRFCWWGTWGSMTTDLMSRGLLMIDRLCSTVTRDTR